MDLPEGNVTRRLQSITQSENKNKTGLLFRKANQSRGGGKKETDGRNEKVVSTHNLCPTTGEGKMNKVFVDGYLGRDPEIKETDIGNVGIFQVANHDNKNGKATWVPIVAFGNKVKTVIMNLKKGDRVVIEGRLRTRDSTAGRYTEVEVLYVLRADKTLTAKPDVIEEPEVDEAEDEDLDDLD
jgi:hypothetical protein